MIRNPTKEELDGLKSFAWKHWQACARGDDILHKLVIDDIVGRTILIWISMQKEKELT
jgi:hypothetical protein